MKTEFDEGIFSMIRLCLVGFLCAGLYSSIYAKPINCVTTSHKGAKEVALTFDDGPSLANTPKILAILKKYKVPATFFVLGEQAKRHPDLLRTIVREGHVLGNHTYSHPVMAKLSARAQDGQLTQTNQLLTPHQALVRWFRPSYGSYNTTTEKLVADKNMTVVLWSIDPLDWKKPRPTPAELSRRVTQQLRPGAIILLHDIHSTTAHALERLIQDVLHQGYTFVPLS